MAYDDGIKTGTLAYVGLVSVIVTFALVLCLQVVYFRHRNALEAATLAEQGPPPELSELTSQQQTALTQRGYVDPQRGLVAVGVTRAKELVVTELAAGKSPAEVNGPARAVSTGTANGAAEAAAEAPESKQETAEPAETTPPKKEGSDET